jgi:hypothetical protein
MEKCPKCGYSEGRDWPGILLMLAFFLVSLVADWGFGAKSVRLASAGSGFLFVAAIVWKSAREDKNRVEYLKSHPPDKERPKII